MERLRINRVIYISMLFFALMFTFYHGGRVPFSLLYMILGLPVVSLILTLIIYARFKFVQDVDTRYAVKGDKVRFVFTVQNEDIIFYPYISITFYGTKTIFARQFETVVFSVPPRGKREFSFELLCRYRGTYEIGVKSIEIVDFLGLFKFRYHIPEPSIVTVLPRIVPLAKFALETDYMSESHTLSHSDQEDAAMISDIRKMAYGDSLKRIHWKLSAKTGEIMVKKYQSTSQQSALLFVDMAQNPYPLEYNTIIEDKVIECAVAIVHHCSSKWIPVDVVFHSRDRFHSISIKNSQMFRPAYMALADAVFDSSAALGNILDIYLDQAMTGMNQIIVTSNIDNKLTENIFKMIVRGHDVSLVYVISGKADPWDDASTDNILRHLAEEGVKVYRIGIEDEPGPILEGRSAG